CLRDQHGHGDGADAGGGAAAALRLLWWLVAAGAAGRFRAGAERAYPPPAPTRLGSSMPLILLSLADDELARYRPAIEQACAAMGLDVRLTTQAEDPAAVDYIVLTPAGPIDDFTPFTGLKAALSLWAGVERIVGNPTLHAPLC